MHFPVSTPFEKNKPGPYKFQGTPGIIIELVGDMYVMFYRDDFPLLGKITNIYNNILESGIMQYLMKLAKLGEVKPDLFWAEVKALSLEQLLFAFNFLAISSVCCSFILFIEIIINIRLYDKIRKIFTL